jgi:hypothetical protein
MVDDKAALTASAAALATAAHSTHFALMKFLVLKGLMSIEDMKQVYLDAATLAQNPSEEKMTVNGVAAAGILKLIAAGIGQRSHPGL